MEQTNTSIYKKILTVMNEVKRIPKNGYNSFHKYYYTTESDLTEEIRPILFQAGLILLPPNVLEQEKNGEFTKVKMEFTLVDADSGQEIKSIFWGEGQDKGDKGLYKAYTGATKYFLMKTFLIATGDDPEQETSNNDQSNKQTQRKQQPAQQKQKTQQTTTAPTPQTGSQGPQKLVSKAQLGKLAAEGNKRGLNDDWQRAWCVTFYKVDSRTKLTASQASKMIEDFMKLTQDQLSEKIQKVKEHFEKIKGGVA